MPATLDSHLHGRGVPGGGPNVKVQIPVRVVLHVPEIRQEDSHAKPVAAGDIERPARGPSEGGGGLALGVMLFQMYSAALVL